MKLKPEMQREWQKLHHAHLVAKGLTSQGPPVNGWRRIERARKVMYALGRRIDWQEEELWQASNEQELAYLCYRDVSENLTTRFAQQF